MTYTRELSKSDEELTLDFFRSAVPMCDDCGDTGRGDAGAALQPFLGRLGRAERNRLARRRRYPHVVPRHHMDHERLRL